MSLPSNPELAAFLLKRAFRHVQPKLIEISRSVEQAKLPAEIRIALLSAAATHFVGACASLQAELAGGKDQAGDVAKMARRLCREIADHIGQLCAEGAKRKGGK